MIDFLKRRKPPETDPRQSLTEILRQIEADDDARKRAQGDHPEDPSAALRISPQPIPAAENGSENCQDTTNDQREELAMLNSLQGNQVAKRIRAVATNSVLEVMATQGRTVMNDNDAGIVAIIQLALAQVQSAEAPLTPHVHAPAPAATAIQIDLEKIAEAAAGLSSLAEPAAAADGEKTLAGSSVAFGSSVGTPAAPAAVPADPAASRSPNADEPAP